MQVKYFVMADPKKISDTTGPVPAMHSVPLAQNVDLTHTTNVKFTLSSVNQKKSAGLSSGHFHKVFSKRSMTLPSFRRHKADDTQSNRRRKLSSGVDQNKNAFPSMEPKDSWDTLHEKDTECSDITDLNQRPLPPTPYNMPTLKPHKSFQTIQDEEPSFSPIKERPALLSEKIESVEGNIDSATKNSSSQQKDQRYCSANVCTTTKCIEQCPLPSSPTTSNTAGVESVPGPTSMDEALCEPLSHMVSSNLLVCPQNSEPAGPLSLHNSAPSTQTNTLNLPYYANTNSATAGNDSNTPNPTTHVSSTPVVKDVTSLSEALDKYAEHFPLRIKVIQGYCSEESEQNLSTNDVYDIYFVKHTRNISLKDKDGYTHHIPLASSMTFGLVYNPINDYDDALIGHEYEKCSDIMAMTPMPKVICAMNTVESTEDRSRIHEHEILAIRNIQKSKFRGRRSLKVFSFLTNTEKLLPDDCAGHFTTKPSLIRLHLSQISQGISDPFPSQAVVYLGAECKMTQNLSNSLSGVVTLCDCTTETFLVVSPVVNGCADDEHQFNLPLNNVTSQIEVQPILPMKTDQFDYIYDDTVTFTECRDPPYVNVVSEHDPGDNQAEKKICGDDTYATVGLENSPMGNSTEQLDSSNEYDTVPFEINGSMCTADHKSTEESRTQSDFER